MKHEIKRYFDAITSERSDEDFLRGALERAEEDMKKHRTFKKAVIIPIAAAVTIAVCGVGVGAAYGFEHLTEVFKGNENITSEIQTDIFSDTDGHVSVTIEQLVSDGRHVHAAVHYEALDEVGQEWLSKDESFGITKDYVNGINQLLKIESFADNGMAYNWSAGSTELKAYRTENERFFYSVAEFCQDVWDKDSFGAVFTYPTSTGIRTADIDVTVTMEIRGYKIIGDSVSSKYMTPVYLDISPLSYSLYAEVSDGVFMEEKLPDGGYRRRLGVPFEEYMAEVTDKELSLVFANGEKLVLPRFGTGFHNVEPCIWQTGGTFDASKYWDWYTRDYSSTLEFDQLIGIEIDGVYYDLIAE